MEALCVSSGQAAVNYAVQNVPSWAATSFPSRSSTAPPIHCSLTCCPARASLSGSRSQIDRKRLRSSSTTIPAPCSAKASAIRQGTSAILRHWRRVAHGHGVPLIVDNTVATPILLRPIEYGADIVVALPDEIPGRPRHHARRSHRRQRKFPLERARSRFPAFIQPDPSYHGLVYTDHFGRGAYLGRCRSVYQRTTGAVLSPSARFCYCKESRRSRCASSAMWRTAERSLSSCAATPGSRGSSTRDSPRARTTRWRRNIWTVALAH